jgi:cytochrome P450
MVGTCNIVVNDPSIVEEMYIQKNCYFDKVEKMKRVMFPLLGNSVILGRQTESHQEKRKQIAAAFYKDRLQGMLKTIIELTYSTAQKLRETHLLNDKPIDAMEVISDLVVESIL